eukprot:PLAT12496.16.p1 GENE.PLAT12496.16~~PLAT12496.16.p1  ORF type:complete len:1587 (+),score=934.98 PLAT12496.16:2689-7449(+)
MSGGFFSSATDEKENASLTHTLCGQESAFDCLEGLMVETALPALYLLGYGGMYMSLLRETEAGRFRRSRVRSLQIVLCMLLAVLPAIVMVLRATPLEAAGPPALFEEIDAIAGGVTWAFCVLLLVMEGARGRGNGWVLRIFWILSLLCETVRLLTVLDVIQLNVEHGTPVSLSRWFFFANYGAHALLVLLGLFTSAKPRPAAFDALGEEEEEMADMSSAGDVVDKDDELPAGGRTPESRAGLLSTVTFSWMSPIMATGYLRQLRYSDLFPIRPSESAAAVAERLRVAWARQMERGEENASLARALWSAFGGTFACAGLFKFIYDLQQFVGPQILKRLIRFLGDDGADWHVGLVLTGIMLGSAVIQSVVLHQYFHRVFRTGMRVRTAIVATIYAKALRLSRAAKEEQQTGQLVNLMSVDAARLQSLMTYLQSVWSSPLQIALALFFLFQEIGVSTLAGVGVIAVMVPIQGRIARSIKAVQKQLMKQRDRRVDVTTEAMSAIKIIKLYAWEDGFRSKINSIRGEELRLLRRYTLLSAATSILWVGTPVAVSLTTFAVFSLMGNELTAERAFTALSLFSVLRFPMSMLPRVINNVLEALVSLNRLRSFFLARELKTMDKLPLAEGSPIAIRLDGGQFFWDDDESVSALSDVSVSINKGELVAVVGETGSGKSALLSALIGDLQPGAGEIALRGDVAYSSQVAWIQNATLRDNILFGREWDEDWYNRVVDACALRPDLAVLPAGDRTEIGEKGINLSGGQKQRISLARAVYADNDIYLLDDCLSAVDSHVQQHIFQHCFLGLLAGKTRVLVTHAMNLLPKADRVVVVRAGVIVADGSYAEVKAMDQDKLGVELRYDEVTDDEEDDDDDDDTSVSRADDDSKEDEADGKSAAAASGKGAAAGGGKGSVAARKGGAASSAAGKLTGKEERQVGAVSSAVYKDYFAATGGRKTIVSVLLAMTLTTAAGLLTSRWLAYWSGDESSHVSANYLLDVYAVLSLCTVVFQAMARLLVALGGLRASRLMHGALLRSLLHARMAFFDTTPIGRVLNRFSKDIYSVDESLPSVMNSSLFTVFTVLGTVVVIVSVTPFFLICILPLTWFYYSVQQYYVASSRELKRWDSVLRSPIYSHFSETVDGRATIKAFDVGQRFATQNSRLLNRNNRAYFLSISANRWLAMRLEFVGSIVISASALFAVISKGRISPGLGGMSISYALSITQTLNWMVRMASEREVNIVSVERLKEYMRVPQEAAYRTRARLPPSWPERGEITLSNLSLRYRKGLDFVLRNVTAAIEECEKVGIVGRTGAGKSSLLLALMRLVEAEHSGSVLIDDIDTSRVGLFDLRSRISIIPQDPVLFQGSVRFNLDPLASCDDSALWGALKRAHLFDKVQSMDGGLDAVVAEGGSNFSVGQRQLMCLARALLRRSRILLLDEATSSVDAKTDALVQATIREVFADRTVLTIAHRIETIMDSDTIMVLDGGRIAEMDAPGELLSDPDSLFSSIVQASDGVTLGDWEFVVEEGEGDDDSDSAGYALGADGVTLAVIDEEEEADSDGEHGDDGEEDDDAAARSSASIEPDSGASIASVGEEEGADYE